MMSDDHTPSLSDEEEEDDLEQAPQKPLMPEMQGYLSKWTNYLHGWQDRWVTLRDGSLSYYKSEFDTAFGCRGSVSLSKATILAHEFDDCRFDVSVNDCVYYLRCSSPESRQKWTDSLEATKAAESGYGSETSLRKGGSMLSLSSVASCMSSTSTSSYKKTRNLREKLMEMETFRDILCRQIDTLQGYFDSCAGISQVEEEESSVELNGDLDADDEMDELSSTPTPATFVDPHQHGHSNISHTPSHYLGIDFKGEAITFKATTSGILATLSHCIEIMGKREDYWQKKFTREQEKRKKAEEALKNVMSEARRKAFISGPDFEEGPHSYLNEEEFFDAMEIALDKRDEEDDEEYFHHDKVRHYSVDDIPPPNEEEIDEAPHRLSKEVESRVKENLMYINESVDSNWTLVHEDGEMKVYRRDYEEGGIVCDPMKATHVIKGVTAHEMAHYFFDKDVRLDWDTTVESFKTLEVLNEQTVIYHQLHKRVWPSSQRDVVYLSHIRQLRSQDVGGRLMNEVGNPWIVCNFSLDHDDAPIVKFVRAMLYVGLFCQTLIEPRTEGEKLTRDHISCRITYNATVNPGGWAPPTVVRAVSKREYPKFLRKISSFCQEVCKSKEIVL